MLGACLPLRAGSLETLTTNVQPMNGTDNGGDTFPGAVVPVWHGAMESGHDPAESGGYLYSATQSSGSASII